MESLNDVVSRYIKGNQERLRAHGITIDANLSDNLPAIYEEELDIFAPGPVYRVLDLLTREIESSYPKWLIYVTGRTDTTQRLLIIHDGKAIPDDEMLNINLKLKHASSGGLASLVGDDKYLSAGQLVAQLGGSFSLENINEKGYTGRVTIELPLNR